jgi:hypothetical protein
MLVMSYMRVEKAGCRAFVHMGAREAKTYAHLHRGAPWSPPMKRIIDWLSLLFLAFALAAAIQLHYAQTKQSYVIWLIVLILNLPFATAALVYLGRRGFNTFPPMTERTKRVIDWLTLIPLGYIPATIVWLDYMHNDHPSAFWLLLLIIDGFLIPASLFWLGLRMDKIPIVHWFAYKFVMRGFFHLFVAVLLLVILIQWLWR